MLLQASRDGNLEVVLRLLYTNPFINKQELRDALWEAVRCRRLEVLRSLLEFKVDPACTPSPGLSRPPSVLRKAQWTPLLGLAVNGNPERADIVAELLSVSSGDGGKQQALPQATAPGHHGAGGSSPTAAPSPSSPSAPSLPSSAPASSERLGSKQLPGSGERLPRAGGEEADEEASSSLLSSLLAGTTVRECEGRLGGLRTEELAAVEGELETLLHMVRSHRTKRWEQQLQSVQRRHAEVSRGRQELEEEQTCVVCSELEKSILFMPCRHLCTCEACAGQLSVCPICRAHIGEKVRCIRP